MNSTKIILLALFAIFAITSCDLLEPIPDNQKDIDYVLKDPQYAEGLYLSSYKSLPSDYLYTEVATDDAVINQNGNDYRQMATGQWSAIFSPVSNWDKNYTAISNINFFLSVVNNVTWSKYSETKNKLFIDRHTGESRALRAYFLMELLKSQAGLSESGELLGVPLVNKYINAKDEWKLPRASFQTVVDQIYADLDTAMILLPYKWASFPSSADSTLVFGIQNIGRIQGQIALALKAKAALWVASPAFNGGVYSMDKSTYAAELTASLLKEINGVLPTDPIFYDTDADITNKDIFWRSDYAVNTTRETANFPPSLFGNGRVNPTQNLVDAFPMKNGYPISNPLSNYDPADPYANRDVRLGNYIILNGSTYRTTVIDVSVNSTTNDGLNKTEYSTRTGYYMKKLLRADANLTPGSSVSKRHFYPYIRYTELFLNYAEMANEAWGPDGDPNGYGFTAKTIIKAIRGRNSNIPTTDPYLASITTKETMRELIHNERRLELCFEGHRFWDIRRWMDGTAITQTAKGVSINNTQFDIIDVEKRMYQLPAAYYGPILQTERNKNSLLEQNKGW